MSPMPDRASTTYGFVITSTETSTKDPGQILRAAMAKKRSGARVGIFLLGDGAYLTFSQAISKALAAGVEVQVSKEHLDAAGLSKAPLPKGAELVEKPYKELVAKVMEEWDRVVVC